MAVNPSRSDTKAATATSLAALRMVGAAPPASNAFRARASVNYDAECDRFVTSSARAPPGACARASIRAKHVA